jgi:hypothetical protein
MMVIDRRKGKLRGDLTGEEEEARERRAGPVDDDAAVGRPGQLAAVIEHLAFVKFLGRSVVDHADVC